ncbi:gliding motility-associated C-terminal domain-containing protein, partial [Myroides odoratimimus]
MKKKIILLGGLLISLSSIAQKEKKDQVLVNLGKFSVAEGGVFSTIYDFNNVATGVVEHNGDVYYYNNFNNDNLYYHKNNAVRSKAVFTKYENKKGKQVISGSKPSDFYHVVLDNAEPIVAFDLKNEANVRGSVDFKDGIIKVDSLAGMLT